MSDPQLAELSRVLFSPVTLVVYVAAMLCYLYAMAVGVQREDAAGVRPGRGARLAGTVLTVAGVGTHLAHIVTRALASGRWPLGNMFEFTTVMALTVVLAGLVVLQWRMRRPQLMGFVLLGGVLTMASALLVYNDPGPLMPILDTYWRAIHVSAIVFAAGVFTVGFVFNALHLLRDTAERRVAEQQTARAAGSTVGAAYTDTTSDGGRTRTGRLRPGGGSEEPPSGGGGDDGGRTLSEVEAVPGRDTPDAPARAAVDDDEGYRRALRAAISPWRLAVLTWLGAAVISWVFIPNQPLVDGLTRFVTVNTALAASALLAWRFVGHLPPAVTLDTIAYRTIAFGFPIWTFAVIAGAIWAEQSWGRYWGWDPKETSAFLTWVAYAAYLHARATRGVRGRGAGWLGVVAFGVLMFTYYAVNLVVTGLHSYAGL